MLTTTDAGNVTQGQGVLDHQVSPSVVHCMLKGVTACAVYRVLKAGGGVVVGGLGQGACCFPSASLCHTTMLHALSHADA